MNIRKACLAILAGLLIGVSPGCEVRDEADEPSRTDGPAREIASTGRETVGSSWGAITGRVIFEGEPPGPRKLMVVKDVAVCGKETHFDERLIVSQGGGIRNAVISILNLPPGKPAKPEREYVLDQTGCDYQPHVLLLPANAPLKILNNDGILHNIHTYSKKNRAVNIAQPPVKKELEMVFSEPENISVRCDIHGWMGAWIIVTDHSYYTITDAEGNFTLGSIPPGNYEIKCWQELLGERIQKVTIESGTTASLVFRYRQAEDR